MFGAAKNYLIKGKFQGNSNSTPIGLLLTNASGVRI
jgi:hypothetical protein